MSGDALSDEPLLLDGFLLTSARGLVDEPQTYGPFRLLEAAGRALGVMDEQGMLDDPLTQIRAGHRHIRHVASSLRSKAGTEVGVGHLVSTTGFAQNRASFERVRRRIVGIQAVRG